MPHVFLSLVLVLSIWIGKLIADALAPYLGDTVRVAWAVMLEAVAIVGTIMAGVFYFAVESDEFEQRDCRTASIIARVTSVIYFFVAGAVGNLLLWRSHTPLLVFVVVANIVVGAIMLIWAERLRTTRPRFD